MRTLVAKKEVVVPVELEHDPALEAKFIRFAERVTKVFFVGAIVCAVPVFVSILF
ncbi:hypothetical protein ACFYKX_11405 [Cytobacillus sp. FJAT-54145]|uniref:Uncharacterized protein n=1 Tax=Cytobacillus spartinae TaxID=3299023 RepID=A0ABW6KAJ6_9BACI